MNEMPVRIRGVEYPSVRAAAAALGVKPNAISTMLARGREDQIGTGRGNHGNQRPPIAPVPIRIGSKSWPSLRSAARGLGIPLARIKRLRKLMKEQQS